MASRHEVNIDLNLTGERAATAGMERFGDATDKTSAELRGMGKDAGVLTRKIAEAEAEVKKLVKQFDTTGDMDLLKSIRKEQSNLRIFERLRKSITDEATAVGSDAGQKIGEGLTLSLRSLRGPAIVGAIGLGALLAPAIGVAIQSAVIGGAGIGGIVGGIVAASQDQQVQSAAKLVGDHVGDELLRAGGAFVKPVIESLNILDAAGSRLADNFGQIGEKLGPVLPGLTGGATGALDNIMGGITRAANAMQPAIRALSAELPKIGDAVGDFFDELSDDPDQAVMGIVAISQAIQTTIDASGKLLSTLGDLFEWSSRSGAAISGTMETLFGWLPVAGGAIERQGSAFREQVAAIDKARDASKDYVDGGIQPIIRAEEEMETATKSATDEINDQIRAMDKMFGRFMDSREVARNYQEAIDDLTESVNKHGASLDIGTEAGRANAETLDRLAESIKETRDNTVLMTGDVEGANTVYRQQVEALRQQAVRLGMSKQAANDLATELLNIPARVATEVTAPGLLEAIARAEYLRRLLGSNAAAARSRPITINGQFYEGDTSGYGGGRAAGGSMYPGQMYTVGERGIELVQMHADGRGATVYSNSQTRSMMSGASGGSAAPPASGGGRIEVVMRYAGPPAMADLVGSIMSMLRLEIADQGGHVQTVLGQPGA
ncbi:MAG TPA: hypothetical protein VFC19_49235 [Candidatus Limnocylindrales bacterium]|nr:hypothetical protein [Candidatus Limnocylindrales bacterium]